MIFVNWPRAPPPSIQFLYVIDSTSFTHLLLVSNNDDRFNKSYGNCSIFVFLSHYWTGNPKSMLSFLCEIIDGENVMRNYPRQGGREGATLTMVLRAGALAPYVRSNFHMLGPIFIIFISLVQFSYVRSNIQHFDMSGPIFIYVRSSFQHVHKVRSNFQHFHLKSGPIFKNSDSSYFAFFICAVLPLLSLWTGQTGDSTWLEMSPLPKSEMKQNWEVNPRNKVIST